LRRDTILFPGRIGGPSRTLHAIPCNLNLFQLFMHYRIQIQTSMQLQYYADVSHSISISSRFNIRACSLGNPYLNWSQFLLVLWTYFSSTICSILITQKHARRVFEKRKGKVAFNLIVVRSRWERLLVLFHQMARYTAMIAAE